MLAKIKASQRSFFALFNDLADQIVLACKELHAFMASPSDVGPKAERIDSIRQNGDRIARETLALLHRSFVTPLERDDIYCLATQLQNILDLVNDVSQSIQIYDVRCSTPECLALCEICTVCTERVSALLAMLTDMGNAKSILVTCRELDRLESKADHLMRSAIARLFREEEDAKRLLSMRAIYEQLEAITDRCEDVAHVVEGIVLKNS